MPHFFLSYARGDDDAYVKRFFQDLSDEVRTHAPATGTPEIGFLDAHHAGGHVQAGARLVDALNTCASFVALCSPAYFLSEACGREWAAFDRRVQRYAAQTGLRPRLLFPIQWFPLDRMPPIAVELSWDGGERSAEYTRDGLRQLIRLQRNREPYLALVRSLAAVLMANSRRHVLPSGDLDTEHGLAAVPSAFHLAAAPEGGPPGAGSAAGQPPAAEVVGAGSQSVHFIVAAPARSELAGARDTRYYGDRPEDWAPYRPRMSGALADYAREVAAQRQFSSEVVGLRDLQERIEMAHRDNQIVVLLVDPWATRYDSQREALESYDQRNEPTTAVLIPMGNEDLESQQNSRDLERRVRETLRNSATSQGGTLFRYRVPDHATFEKVLEQVLRVAQNRVFVHGNVYRSPPGDTVNPRPILQGPH